MKIILTPIPCTNRYKVTEIHKDGTVIEREISVEAARYMYGI